MKRFSIVAAILLLVLVVGASGCSSGGDGSSGDEDRTDSASENLEGEASETSEEEACEACQLEEYYYCEGNDLMVCNTNENGCCECTVAQTCELGCNDDGDGLAGCVEPEIDGDEEVLPDGDSQEPDLEPDVDEVISDVEESDSEVDGDGVEEIDGEDAPTECDECGDEESDVQDVDESVSDGEPEPDLEEGRCFTDDDCVPEQFCYMDGYCYDRCSDTIDCIERALGDTCDSEGRCIFASDGDETDTEPETQTYGEISGTVFVGDSILPENPVLVVKVYNGLPGTPNIDVFDAEVQSLESNKWFYRIGDLPSSVYYVEAELFDADSEVLTQGYMLNPINIDTAGTEADRIVQGANIYMRYDCSSCAKVSGSLYVGDDYANMELQIGLATDSSLSYVPIYAQLGQPQEDGSIPYTILGIPEAAAHSFRLFARAIWNGGEAKRTVYPQPLIFASEPPGAMQYNIDLYLGITSGELGIIQGTLHLPDSMKTWHVSFRLYKDCMNCDPFDTRPADPDANGDVPFEFVNLEEGFYFLHATVTDPADVGNVVESWFTPAPFTVIEGSDTWREWRSVSWNFQPNVGLSGIIGKYVVSERSVMHRARLVIYQGSATPETSNTPLIDWDLPPAIVQSFPREVPWFVSNLAPGNYRAFVCIDYQDDLEPSNDYCQRWPEIIELMPNGVAASVEIAHDTESTVTSTMYVNIHYPESLASAPLYVRVFRQQPTTFDSTPNYVMPLVDKDPVNGTAVAILPNLRGTYFIQAGADVGTAGDWQDDILAPYADEFLNYVEPTTDTIDVFLDMPNEPANHGEITGTVHLSEHLMGLKMFVFTQMGGSGDFLYATVYGRNSTDNTYKYVIKGLLDASYLVKVWVDLNGDGVFQNSETGAAIDGATVINASNRIHSGVDVYLNSPVPGYASFSGVVQMPQGYLDKDVYVIVSSGPLSVDDFHQEYIELIRMVGPADEEQNVKYFDYVGPLTPGQHYLYLILDTCGDALTLQTDSYYIFNNNNPYTLSADQHMSGLTASFTEAQAQCPGR